MTRRALMLAAVLLLPLAGPACADRPDITFANHRDYPVSVHVGGDRVLILAPHTSEGLHYMVAAWTWRRQVEIRDYATGRVMSAVRMSAGDLAERGWRVDIW